MEKVRLYIGTCSQSGYLYSSVSLPHFTEPFRKIPSNQEQNIVCHIVIRSLSGACYINHEAPQSIIIFLLKLFFIVKYILYFKGKEGQSDRDSSTAASFHRCLPLFFFFPVVQESFYCLLFPDNAKRSREVKGQVVTVTQMLREPGSSSASWLPIQSAGCFTTECGLEGGPGPGLRGPVSLAS